MYELGLDPNTGDVIFTKKSVGGTPGTSVTTDSSLTGIGTAGNPLSIKHNWSILATQRTVAPSLYDTQATYKVYEYTYGTTKYYRRVYNTYDPTTDTFYLESSLTTAIVSRALSI